MLSLLPFSCLRRAAKFIRGSDESTQTRGVVTGVSDLIIKKNKWIIAVETRRVQKPWFSYHHCHVSLRSF
jgi:hypothetical protein